MATATYSKLKMVKYLIYRHGSNAANQGMTDTMPVAIVEAKSREEALETVRHDPPGKMDPYAPSYLALDEDVEVWANQTLSARPLSRAKKSDVSAVRENESDFAM
jgi:hypothetical protein